MDTQWGTSKSVTGANSTIWAVQSSAAIAVSRAEVWITATVVASHKEKPKGSPAKGRGTRGGTHQRECLARAEPGVLVAWGQRCEVCSATAVHKEKVQVIHHRNCDVFSETKCKTFSSTQSSRYDWMGSGERLASLAQQSSVQISHKAKGKSL